MNNSNRIIVHPILNDLTNRRTIRFTFNRKEIAGIEGDTIASALLANGIRTIRLHEESGTPRGIYCNIGHCFECRVTVDGLYGSRSCLTLIEDGMKVEGGQKLPTPLRKEVN
ncbi:MULTISPECIES: (2Fe-2S)-binding protein [Bacillus]|uniref:(2Fe-2S)-binding protein n=1 Tax=Bacillus TaxID=1386 RepID=UPI0002D5DBC2|nr:MULTISPECIES: (2Fe-2S)-binding protein [Bacillus]